MGCFQKSGLRPSDDRIDEEGDRVLVGVVGTDLRPLVGVEPALEQGPEEGVQSAAWPA
jgi:hypothetical protein